MNLYEFISVIVVPFTILHFCIDYLSDRDITKSEVKIGITQLLHHFILVTHVTGFTLLPFFKCNLQTAVTVILVSIIAQIGWLINKDYCWMLTMTNKMINSERPARKWRGEIMSLIKHYLRNDNWAYSDIKHVDNFNNILYMNTMHLFTLFKLILF